VQVGFGAGRLALDDNPASGRCVALPSAARIFSLPVLEPRTRRGHGIL